MDKGVRSCHRHIEILSNKRSRLTRLLLTCLSKLSLFVLKAYSLQMECYIHYLPRKANLQKNPPARFREFEQNLKTVSYRTMSAQPAHSILDAQLLLHIGYICILTGI